jgi:hypothetical protein
MRLLKIEELQNFSCNLEQESFNVAPISAAQLGKINLKEVY